jgi:hypothetical protein
MWLRLVVPCRRGRAGLGGLTPPRRPLAGALALAAVLACGCAGSHAPKVASTSSVPAPTPRGPAFGLTEEDAPLLSDAPPAPATPAGAGLVAAARERLAALHPGFVRLLVDWAALQPDPRAPPALEASVDGCARETGPCAGYRGIAAELAAIGAQQRADRAGGRTAYQVVLDVFGVPAWAAQPAAGCEPPATQPFSRPITAAGLAGYRALIRSLLALGAREGVELSWWSPWNEPNNPQFLGPQRASCASSSRPLAPAVYAQLAQAMAGELDADGATHHLLLGELAGYTTGSPERTSVAEFVAALPEGIACLSADWAIHAYASYASAASSGDPVAALESALERRGGCARGARVWITEAGAGAPHPGRRRPPDAAAEHEGCLALGAQLERWAADPRVEAIFQYTFRDDPAFPVGLLSADLAHVRRTYGLWQQYTRARALGQPPPSPAQLCA